MKQQTAQSNNTIWIDSEVHLFPPEWCKQNYFPPALEETINRVIYNHPEKDMALSQATVDGLLMEMERSHIDHALVMGLPWRSAEMCWRNNDYIFSVANEYSGNLTGIGILPAPDKENIKDAIKKICENYGFKGVKVIPSWQNYRLDDPIFEPAIEEMILNDLVLIPHTDHLFLPVDKADTAYALFAVKQRYPKLKILAPHLGGLLCLYAIHQPIKKVLRNMMFITSVPATMKMVRFAIEAVGAERLVFGTDFPFNPSHDQQTVCKEFEDLNLSEKVKRLIVGINLSSFLNWIE
jgi:predicted TIM-barrel fold metal-dependent hydrolase